MSWRNEQGHRDPCLLPPSSEEPPEIHMRHRLTITVREQVNKHQPSHHDHHSTFRQPTQHIAPYPSSPTRPPMPPPLNSEISFSPCPSRPRNMRTQAYSTKR